jgi:hypothetical protein
VVQSSPKPAGGVVGKSPLSSLLWQGFLLPSVLSPLSGCASLIAKKGNEFRVNGLSQSHKWPVWFDPSGEIVVWEQSDEIWDGEAGDSSYPLGILPPSMALD